MSKANLCRVCGWTGERAMKETRLGPVTDPDDTRRWAGTNHNLCTACIESCNVCNGSGLVLFGRCNRCRGNGTLAKDMQPSTETINEFRTHVRAVK